MVSKNSKETISLMHGGLGRHLTLYLLMTFYFVEIVYDIFRNITNKT